MALIVPNFVRTALRAPCAPSDVQLFLTPGTGYLFDAVTPGNYCYVTVNDGTSVEVMRYSPGTSVSNDAIPVVRGQDNTTPKSFPIGSCVAIGWNNEQILDFIDQEVLRLGVTGPPGPTGPLGPRGPTGPKMMPTPYDYGAIGDGIVDDTAAIQAWLLAIAGGAGYGEKGIYLMSAPAVIYSGTTIYGAGPADCVFVKATSFGLDSFLFNNQNWVFSGNPWVDYDIEISNCAFDGAFASCFTGGLIAMYGVQTFKLLNCYLLRAGNIGLGLFNCWQVEVSGTEFFQWDGPPRLDYTMNPDANTAIFTDSYTLDLLINNNNFHNSGGAALSIHGKRMTVTNNVFTHMTGAAIYSPDATDLIVSHNQIAEITRASYDMNIIGVNTGAQIFTVGGDQRTHVPPGTFCSVYNSTANNGYYSVVSSSLIGGNTDVNVAQPIPSALVNGILNAGDFSASGMEVGGIGLVINNNRIFNVQYAGINIQNGIDVSIVGNSISLPGQGYALPPPLGVQYTPAAGIAIFTFEPGPLTPTPYCRNITVSGNVISCTNAFAPQAISCVRAAGGVHPVMDDILICDNNVAQGTWAVTPFLVDTGAVGTNFVRRGNLGTGDDVPYCAGFSITNGMSSATIPVTGMPFRPRSVVVDVVAASGTLVAQCTNTVTDTSTLCNTTASDAGGFFGTNGVGIKVYDGSGTLLIDGQINSFYYGGFDVFITSATQNAVATFTAMP